MKNTETTQTPAASDLSASTGYDQKLEDKRQVAKMIAIMGGFACMEMPMLRIRRNAADIRHDPSRPKNDEDLECIEAARRKQERKAARRQKFNSHNVEARQNEAQPRD